MTMMVELEDQTSNQTLLILIIYDPFIAIHGRKTLMRMKIRIITHLLAKQATLREMIRIKSLLKEDF